MRDGNKSDIIAQKVLTARGIEYIMLEDFNCQSNSSEGRGHDRLPKVTFAEWRIVRQRWRNQAILAV